MVWTPASLFAPADTGGWFDAADLGTLFQDSAGTVPVTGDTQPVGLIKAKAGAGSVGFHLAQATSAAKPTYKTAAGQSWLQFDGGDWLDSGLSRFGRAGLHAASSESWTVVVAIRAHPDGAYVGGTYVARAGSTSAAKTFQLYTANGLHGWVLRGTVTSNITAAAGVFGARWDGAAAKIRFGNAEQAGTVGTAVEETTQRILVGARSNGAGSLLSSGGSIAQVFFIDRALTATELDYLYWYFAQSIGQTGIGAAPPSSEVMLDAVVAVAAALPVSPSLISSPVLATADVTAAGSSASAAILGAPVLAAGGGVAPAVTTLAAVSGAPGLVASAAAAAATTTAAGLWSTPILGAVPVAPPGSVDLDAVQSLTALEGVNACAAGMAGLSALAGEWLLAPVAALAPGVLAPSALVSNTMLGISEAGATPVLGLVAIEQRTAVPLRSARVSSRDAASRRFSQPRQVLSQRQAAPVLTTRAA